ncbi:hypothetical protein PQO01_21110 [Lentisphaera marina]|uniref:hypothetical protein n=1 Tax=Lentisphaera marina TaxID=1111041 RepID=UPI002366A1CC|nr:hypothetical protein [Lentisphaera marina]MDD7987460.1 hypothetical protein [Lentisphaera marina]
MTSLLNLPKLSSIKSKFQCIPPENPQKCQREHLIITKLKLHQLAPPWEHKRLAYFTAPFSKKLSPHCPLGRGMAIPRGVYEGQRSLIS